MIKKLPKEFLSVISQNNGLEQYLSNLLIGRSFTPRSWLYENVKNADDILTRWKDKLAVLQNGSTFEQEVYQFDISQEEKWGPQGGIAPISDLLDSVVLPSFQDHPPVPRAFTTDDWEVEAEIATINDLMDYGIRGLRPASYERVVDDMRARDTLESNSGWPDFTRRNKPEVIDAAIAAAKNGAWQYYPAIALFRNYRNKTRLVWMFPMAANIVEGSYFQPLQSSFVKVNHPFYAPWVGFEKVREAITEAYDSGKYIAASDFSSTDAHFQIHSTRAIQHVLGNLLQRQYFPGLQLSLERMHNIPLIIGPDQMVSGYHGVSSGSNWTNFVETVFDHVFSNYVEIKMGYPAYTGLYAIGDDMAWVSDVYQEDFAQKLEIFGKEVGQVIKAEKTTNERNKVKTLQRLFQRGYRRPDGLLRGVYSTIRALNSSVYPERYHDPKKWSSDMFCARQYMILENCVDHPLFEEFVKYVVQGQKDLIPFAKKDDAELERIHRKTKLLPGLNTTYNQEKRDTSLSNFESVKLARKF